MWKTCCSVLEDSSVCLHCNLERIALQHVVKTPSSLIENKSKRSEVTRCSIKQHMWEKWGHEEDMIYNEIAMLPLYWQLVSHTWILGRDASNQYPRLNGDCSLHWLLTWDGEVISHVAYLVMGKKQLVFTVTLRLIYSQCQDGWWLLLMTENESHKTLKRNFCCLRTLLATIRGRWKSASAFIFTDKL